MRTGDYWLFPKLCVCVLTKSGSFATWSLSWGTNLFWSWTHRSTQSVEKHYQIPQVQIGFCTYQTHPACWTAPAPIAPLRRCVNTRSLTFAEPCITLAAFEPWAQASDQVSLGNIIFLSRSGCLLYFEAEVSDAVSYPNLTVTMA